MGIDPLGKCAEVQDQHDSRFGSNADLQTRKDDDVIAALAALVSRATYGIGSHNEIEMLSTWCRFVRVLVG